MFHLRLFLSMSLLADLRGGGSRFAAPGDFPGLAAPASGFAETGGEGTTVVLLLDGGFDPLTLGAFCSVLGSGREGEAYRMVFASATGGDLEGLGGLRISTLPACDVDPGPDILLVLGGSNCETTPREPLAGWLRAVGARCGRVYAIGWGARLLHALGEPRGSRPADSWDQSSADEALRHRDAPVLQRHGRVWVSPGNAAAIDVALIIVEEDRGARRALASAASLRLSARRAAGDPSVGRTLRLQLRSGARFGGLIDAIRNNPTMRADVETLAELSGMSPRTFARRFQRETGVTPATAVEAIRLEIAQALRSSGALTVKEIAARSGFGSEARLRSATRRCAATPPPNG